MYDGQYTVDFYTVLSYITCNMKSNVFPFTVWKIQNNDWKKLLSCILEHYKSTEVLVVTRQNFKTGSYYTLKI